MKDRTSYQLLMFLHSTHTYIHTHTHTYTHTQEGLRSLKIEEDVIMNLYRLVVAVLYLGNVTYTAREVCVCVCMNIYIYICVYVCVV
jgi:myosin heavy subunit